MSETITFFDLPSKAPCRAWSLNPWKTRLLLNFKGLDYKTEWVEYPDIKPRLEKRVEPNERGNAYTIPAIALPGGKYIMDSRKIVTEIEKLHPTPSVHLDSPYLAKLEEIMPKLLPPLTSIYILRTPQQILNEASVPYWNKTREAFVGMPLEKFVQEHGGDEPWKAAEALIKEVTALLRENTEGPFFMGETVSYADFVWGGFLVFIRRYGPDVWAKFLEASGDGTVHENHLEGLKPWTARDDH